MVWRRKKIKVTHEEGFEEESLDIRLPTRAMCQTRKQSEQIKSKNLLKSSHNILLLEMLYDKISDKLSCR